MSEHFQKQISQGIPEEVPGLPAEEPGVSHAPPRKQVLNKTEQVLALKNALRYFDSRHHEKLAPEFAGELVTDGRIYMRRFRPTYKMFARPISEYPARCQAAAAIMHMIQNNLNPAVAQHPYELITYGGNGTVFQNWAQYLITMKYLSQMTAEQTLVLYSGHPLGLFPSHPQAPRLVLTCGMVIPNHSSPQDYDRLSALGVTSYGQMTAGSFMYIGPQGIVHGTAITLLNAGRKYLILPAEQGLAGQVFLTSGLGGMSGAQAKAAVITSAVGLIAEIDPLACKKRHDQGWVMEVESDLDKVLLRTEKARQAKQALSLAYLGNVVDLWEKCARESFPIELGSDQTSLHIPFSGGYYPAGLSLEASRQMMRTDPNGFKEQVQVSLRRQVDAINQMHAAGMVFWDYGNAFLLEAARAKAAVTRPDGSFCYPSYVEDIMGPICFDYGFGPFRWVCLSGQPEDLRTTDSIAAEVLDQMAQKAPKEIRQQLLDNLHWIRAAESHQMVVGSQARILYSNEPGRIAIARAFNQAVCDGRLSGPVVLGRDHHDTGGTDSPYRETANIQDGSFFCADMAVHNVIGDSFRGASWVSLHNGGGVGWGEVVNGGFGLVLDGTQQAETCLERMLYWDVNNGIARRAWARNSGAIWAAQEAMHNEAALCVTLPHIADDGLAIMALDQSNKKES
ncbi:MAG: urocanate hydratase [Deltaproteobacteria bacterium]|nr:urocanate hydratase [Deltaproteobacteria bacterium]